MTDKKPGLSFLKNPVHLLALGFGAGCSPVMPGTVGTLVGVLLYIVMMNFSLLIYLAVTLIFILAGVWICGQTTRHLGVDDHQAIVWDEIVGYLITMLAVPHDWPWMVAGFLLFRLFDITKPWPVSWADKQVKGGLGIMLDDVLAGIYACLVLQITVYLL